MKIEITDYIHDPHPRQLEGEPDEIERFLREEYPEFCDGVKAGDLWTLAKEIGRSSYIHIAFLDGEPTPKPHLHPHTKRYDEDPWVREDDFPDMDFDPPKRNGNL